VIGINGEKRCHETRSRFHLDRPRQVGRGVKSIDTSSVLLDYGGMDTL